jgi:hypothetical protein
MTSSPVVGAHSYSHAHFLTNHSSMMQNFTIKIPSKAYHTHFDKTGEVKTLSCEVIIEFSEGIGKIIQRKEEMTISQHYMGVEVWKNEAESVRELFEIEPESKWALITLVYLMRDIVKRKDTGEYDEIVEWVDKLAEIDASRKGYYKDLRSEVLWERVVRGCQGGFLQASGLGLTRLPTVLIAPFSSRLALLTSLDLSGNKLGPLAFPEVRKKGNGEECKPVLPMLKRLILKGNLIQRISLQVVEYCDIEVLEHIDMRDNPLLEDGEKFGTRIIL